MNLRLSVFSSIGLTTYYLKVEVLIRSVENGEEMPKLILERIIRTIFVSSAKVVG
jgi:hypothetical protein